MLQLLYPWWMLALPICGLPWIWPVLRTPQGKFLPFSTLFLFPKEKLSRHFQWSSKEWLLKLLRSLLLLVLILLLAKPYFGSSEVMREITILDDTLVQSASLFRKLGWENSSVSRCCWRFFSIIFQEVEGFVWQLPFCHWLLHCWASLTKQAGLADIPVLSLLQFVVNFRFEDLLYLARHLDSRVV